MPELDAVLAALKTIRAPRTQDEYDLHALIATALQEASLPCRHEVPVALRRRIDFVSGTVGVEVKRGKPPLAPLIRQLTAYAESNALSALVLVAERPPHLPQTLCGKPLICLSLMRLWGIAL